MDFLVAILYGIIEGFAEWLPISSTGHLIIFENLLPFQAVSKDFLEMLRVVVQLGAILSVVTTGQTFRIPPNTNILKARALPISIASSIASIRYILISLRVGVWRIP
ncbi:MAG: undecaprenyl-diphosphate phosphatase [Clostridia bacterium]|nr:undecaprenyl-diphosphate phosphatase [Clostridia bacterium]